MTALLPLELPVYEVYEAVIFLRKRGMRVYREGGMHIVVKGRNWRSARVTLSTDEQLRDFARSQGWRGELSPASTLSTPQVHESFASTKV